MHDRAWELITQFFAWLAAIAAALGIATQDLVFIGFGLIGVGISVLSFLLGRIDARRRYREDQKRTALISDYLRTNKDKHPSDRPAAVKVVVDALKRRGG